MTTTSRKHTQAAVQHHEPTVRPRPEHNISRRNIDPDALKVLYRLVDQGHTAYLVGGSVRDLLLGRKPKDFDISTDAHPGRLKKLFRNCFLIGRRFRLAHIKFGDKVIETSTFRRQPESDGDPDDPDSSLFHPRDNTFGTPEEDALRRDFTINGLFYDIDTFSVIDHVGGLRDLEKGVIRCIGDPDTRFREDPVRMVRAVRFASRLGFSIEPQTRDAIVRHHRELAKASSARMLEEIYRLFAFGSGEKAFQLLHETRLLQVILPEIDVYVTESSDKHPPLWPYLAALDAGKGPIREPTPCLMFGSLFYPLVRVCAEELRSAGERFAYEDLVKELVHPLGDLYPVPRGVLTRLVWALAAQRRFLGTPSRRFSMPRFLAHDAFPEALALYAIHIHATQGDLRSLRAWEARHEAYLKEGGPGHPAAGDCKRRPARRRNTRRRTR